MRGNKTLGSAFCKGNQPDDTEFACPTPERQNQLEGSLVTFCYPISRALQLLTISNVTFSFGQKCDVKVIKLLVNLRHFSIAFIAQTRNSPSHKNSKEFYRQFKVEAKKNRFGASGVERSPSEPEPLTWSCNTH
jgi:uncharacterized protein (UPF0305 family)